jgi:NADPH:quinone reductase-like Zn-dependent oxidoreductase
MQAITVRDHASGLAGLSLSEMPFPRAAENDVVVRVHAAGFTPGELDLPATWTDRTGRARMSSVPGHELSGVVIHLGFGTAGLRVGQRVVGMADWARNGALAEYVAVEARNLTPLPADVDDVLAAAIPIAGLTAWQGLFDHGKLNAGQTVLIHGVAGAAASFAVQLARQAGAYVIGTGSAKDREPAAELGVDVFIDLEHECLEDAGQIDLLFDTVGGEILLQRSAALVRAGGTLVTTVRPTHARPVDGRAVFFVAEPDRHRLADLVQRVREGRLKPAVGAVCSLAEAAAELAASSCMRGKTIIRPTADASSESS